MANMGLFRAMPSAEVADEWHIPADMPVNKPDARPKVPGTS